MSASVQAEQLLLQQRARALARRAEREPTPGSELELLEFRLADERYAIESRFVSSVHPLRELTPLPCTPAFVLGLVNVRARIVPVIDLKKFFELPEQGLTDLHRVIVVRAAGIELGVLADVIVGLSRVPSAALAPSLSTLSGIRAEYLQGVSPDRLVVLALERILSDPKLLVQEVVES